jgi:glutaredoxin-related protein
MTPKELYELLDKAGVDYEVVDIYEGLRILRVVVLEDEEDAS